MNTWIRFNPELNLAYVMKKGTEVRKLLFENGTMYDVDELAQTCEKLNLDLNSVLQASGQDVSTLGSDIPEVSLNE